MNAAVVYTTTGRRGDRLEATRTGAGQSGKVEYRTPRQTTEARRRIALNWLQPRWQSQIY
jgi:hypothetical protein